MPRSSLVIAACVAIAGATLVGCSTSDTGTGAARSASASASATASRSATGTSAPAPRTVTVTTRVVTTAPTTPTAPTTTPPTITTPTITTPIATPRSSDSATNDDRAAGTLPVDEPVHDADQVITVVAPTHHSTTAVLQRWRRVGHGWRRVGSSVPANLGTDGMTRHPSESRSATPIGSFTLTTAFGHDADPGTRLPYVRTTPDDWWISQPGPLYNTRRRCASNCNFTRGDPNEHLYYETPAYDYAVVIDYNTRNAPGGVRQGAGSAFFLHVSEGRPTAGCVSIPVHDLLRVLAWLRPASHPRILIGTG